MVISIYQHIRGVGGPFDCCSSRESNAGGELGWWLPHCELPQPGCVQGQTQQQDPGGNEGWGSAGPDIAGPSNCHTGGAGAATGLGENSAVSVLGRESAAHCYTLYESPSTVGEIPS